MRHFHGVSIPIGLHTCMVLTASIALTFVAPAQGAEVMRVSETSTGASGNGPSDEASMSGDGRFVAFTSDASNLVAGDTNTWFDVFIRDLETGEVTRLTEASNGDDGNDWSVEPSSNYDGRFVAFLSWASNLVENDTNDEGDVFVHDRKTGEITRVSVSSAGVQSNDFSCSPAISADGRVVVFFSDATNLVSGDTNGQRDIFAHDRVTGETTRVSVSTLGAQSDDWSWSPDVSADGRIVAFDSDATNLVPGDTNGVDDVFVHDRETGETTRVSVAQGGAQGNAFSEDAVLSANGRLVAFESEASNLIANDRNGDLGDIFVHDRETGINTLVNVATDGTPGDNNSFTPSMDADGRIVGFHSWSETYIPSDTNDAIDAFVHDRKTGITTLVSVTTAGTQANDTSRATSLDEDGRLVAFESDSGLEGGDFNGVRDVFVYDRGAAVVTRTLVSAVLPTSRSVQVGTPATAFATIINTAGETGTECNIRVGTTGLGTFSYQTTDATNQTVGTADTPIDIAGGNGLQTFLISLTPLEEFESVDVKLLFDCTNGHPAQTIAGVNTLLMSASPTPVPDIVALAATPTGDGIVDIPGPNGANAFAVATVNVGIAGTITASVDTGDAVLPLNLFICDTDSQGQCLNDPATEITTDIPANATPTYTIFVNGDGDVPLNAATNRIFVRFKTPGGVTAGSTSVAAQTVAI